jgi:CHAT domain-containing protein
MGLRNLGDALRALGDLERSSELLQQSLVAAQVLENREELAKTYLSLLRTNGLQGNLVDAQDFYNQTIALANSPIVRVHAQISWFRFLVRNGNWENAEALAQLIPTQLEQLSASRTSIYAHINFSQNLLELGHRGEENVSIAPSIYQQVIDYLQIANQQAQELQDVRAQSFALGTLGELYEREQDWVVAQDMTLQALKLAQQINALDIAYLWEWQLGRLFKVQGNQDNAIASYANALKTLQSIRSDLVFNPEVQFSFREKVEPLHREFIQLLLGHTSEKQPDSIQLEQARETIEALQLAELDNFFREACLNAQFVQLEQLDINAAVIYPIILSDSLEVILSLPQQPLKHYSLSVTQSEVKDAVDTLFNWLKQPPAELENEQFLVPAQDIYQWLIQPAEGDLSSNQVKTLVFVLDGFLRNIPMAVLHDGERFLIEKYNIALAPGLQLLSSQQLQRQRLGVLMAGVSEARQGFSALPNVPEEIEKIQTIIPNRSQSLLDENFTSETFQEAINRQEFPVIHLATHGQFGSRFEDTFILTGDGQININQLRALLQGVNLNRRHPIELLILSACETAAGDERASLGLAGVAVRSGARSTIATLWQVSDEATPLLMEEFYKALVNSALSKAESLRQAQLSLLNNAEYGHPFFWSSYVLIGSWL